MRKRDYNEKAYPIESVRRENTEELTYPVSNWGVILYPPIENGCRPDRRSRACKHKNVKMSSKRWCFTLNNYADSDFEAFHEAADRAYVIIGKEVGVCGTNHLQGYITFYKMKRLPAVRAISTRAHWEIARGSTDDNIKYCSKGGDFYELGERPRVGARGKFVDAVAMVVAGNNIIEVATENPEAYARGGRGLRELQYVLSKPYEHTGVRGYWYCGPPGTGKSHKARMDNEGAYIKAQNKWWDGYNGEKVVILEDMDDGCLKHYLKIWADKWSCSGETKGGHVHLQHQKFIVTSNFTIEELFGENEQIMQAIKRRFEVLKFGNHVFNPAIAHLDAGLHIQAGTDLEDSDFLSSLDDEYDDDIEGELLRMGAFQ